MFQHNLFSKKNCFVICQDIFFCLTLFFDFVCLSQYWSRHWLSMNKLFNILLDIMHCAIVAYRRTLKEGIPISSYGKRKKYLILQQPIRLKYVLGSCLIYTLLCVDYTAYYFDCSPEQRENFYSGFLL